MAGIAVATIVAKNFLPFARVLARSISAHHPTVPFFAVLADRVDSRFVAADEPFETVLLDDLGIPALQRLCFGYSRQQLTIAVKPYLLKHLLGRGFTTAIFLDADILVLNSLQPLFDETSAHAIALTPHLLEPPATGDRYARELNILQSGVYNGGFVGVSQHESAHRFLDWWADRLETHCLHDVPRGMHYDQRWLDLVPSLFDDVHIVRDPRCNVAYWNLLERRFTLLPHGGPDDDRRCRFFHFSGFEPDHPQNVTRYARHLTVASIGPAESLFARYADLLLAEGFFACRMWPYGYAAFDNGVSIPEAARQLYRELDAAVDQFGDPFQASGSHSYFGWLNGPAEAPPGSTGSMTRLWHAIYRRTTRFAAGVPRGLRRRQRILSRMGRSQRPQGAWHLGRVPALTNVSRRHVAREEQERVAALVPKDERGGWPPLSCRSPATVWRRPLLLRRGRLRARAVVGLEVTHRVLHEREVVQVHVLHRVDAFVVTARFVEYAAFAFATNVAERVVAVGACRCGRFLILRRLRHGGVIDTREHVHVGARERVLRERVRFVDHFKALPTEHDGERALRVVHLHRDVRAVHPVELEVAADDLVEFRPAS